MTGRNGPLRKSISKKLNGVALGVPDSALDPVEDGGPKGPEEQRCLPGGGQRAESGTG